MVNAFRLKSSFILQRRNVRGFATCSPLPLSLSHIIFRKSACKMPITNRILIFYMVLDFPFLVSSEIYICFNFNTNPWQELFIYVPYRLITPTTTTTTNKNLMAKSLATKETHKSSQTARESAENARRNKVLMVDAVRVYYEPIKYLEIVVYISEHTQLCGEVVFSLLFLLLLYCCCSFCQRSFQQYYAIFGFPNVAAQ